MKTHSLRKRITFTLIALVMVQGLVLVLLILGTGAIKRNDLIAYSSMAALSNRKKIELQHEFNNKRKNLTVTAEELSAFIIEMVEQSKSDLSQIVADGELSDAVMERCINVLIDFTKYNSVTGVFAVFDPAQDMADVQKNYRTALHLRDSSPGIVAGNNSNLLLEYGRVDIARRHGIAVDYLWTQNLSFNDDYSRDFYFNPINAASEAGASADPHACGYWSPPFMPRRADIQVITYTLPLFDENGAAFGVLGFELDISILREMLPSNEIPYDNGFFLLGVDTGDGLYNDRMVASGVYANRFLSGPRVPIKFTPLFENEISAVCRVVNGNFPRDNAIGAYNALSLYDTYSPFNNEKWTVLCMAPQASAMAGSTAVKNALVISIGVGMVFALVFALVTINYLFHPIQWLYERVTHINPEQPVRFENTRIREIDELSGAFEVLSDRVFKAASRLFTIIELVGMPLGSFEIDQESDKVGISGYFSSIIRSALPMVGDTITVKDWEAFLQTLVKTYETTDRNGVNENLYRTGAKWDSQRWFRTRCITENNRVIGVIMDVTDEVEQKKRLEFERDHDTLTKLYNRAAFFAKACEQAQSASNTAGVMIFVDMDDLKFVNDQFGHETGDEHIKAFANFMLGYEEKGAVVGRLAGDEFILFMNGFETKTDAKRLADEFSEKTRELYVTALNGGKHRIRVSTGLAYYPDDSNNIMELYRYADFATYEAKHTAKGEPRSFDLSTYQKKYFVLTMKNVLDLFIEERMLQFAFQPIVDIQTGEIFAYEALMRPTAPDLQSPNDVLMLARAQSKLYHIERLTFTMVLAWLTENKERLAGRKLFINSIPGVVLTDLQHIFYVYQNVADSVIFEITENEFSDEEDTRRKVEMFRSFGAMVAIDDYGSGYSNELGLLMIKPDFLKIDMGFISGIDHDTDKLHLVSNIIAFAQKKQIHTIAEGVETSGEMETVIKLGAEYIQGFYLGKPHMDIADIDEELKKQLKSVYLNNIANQYRGNNP